MARQHVRCRARIEQSQLFQKCRAPLHSCPLFEFFSYRAICRGSFEEPVNQCLDVQSGTADDERYFSSSKNVVDDAPPASTELCSIKCFIGEKLIDKIVFDLVPFILRHL